VVFSGTTSNYGYELSDLHGTATVTISSTGTGPVWKQYTPYGAPRGGAPGTGWLDPNGYLDQPQDTSDGLTTLGARDYDPSLGRFISLDPVLETSDPQELNGYTYAASNPVTGSDPSGRMLPGGSGQPASGDVGDCNLETGHCAGGPIAPPSSSPAGAGGCSGVSGKLASLCQGSSNTSVCDATCLAIQQAAAMCSSKGGQLNGTSCEITPPPSPHHWWQTALEIAAVVVVVVAVALIVGPALIAVAGAGAALMGGMSLGTCMITVCAAAIVESGIAFAAATGGGDAVDTIYDGGGGGAADPTSDPAGDPVGGAPLAVAKAQSTKCSFVGTTAVLMADGSSEPIEDVQIGDKVTNAVPGDKVTEQHTVTAVHVTDTDRSFVDLTIATPDGPKKLITTANHRFYDATTIAWTVAADLRPGDQLDTPGEGRATILAVHSYVATGYRMYNLTIDTVHTYYVEAGTTPVLVHNACGVSPYQVGTYSQLKADSKVGDGLDIHHVPQGQPAGQVIPGYDYANALAIALPRAEHANIPNLRGFYGGTSQDLIAGDLQNLQNLTNTPPSAIQELIDLIDQTYPGAR
jgi:RHS repeat-associated protein